MNGTRRKRNLIVDIIKTRSQEIHKLLSSTPQETWKPAFWARARDENHHPLLWRFGIISFFQLTEKVAWFKREDKSCTGAQNHYFPSSYKHHHILILDLSRDGQWKGKKGFPKKKVFLFLYPLERRCEHSQTKTVFLPMPRKLELMFNILFTPLLNYSLQKCQSTLKGIFPSLSYLSIFS